MNNDPGGALVFLTIVLSVSFWLIFFALRDVTKALAQAKEKIYYFQFPSIKVAQEEINKAFSKCGEFITASFNDEWKMLIRRGKPGSRSETNEVTESFITGYSKEGPVVLGLKLTDDSEQHRLRMAINALMDSGHYSESAISSNSDQFYIYKSSD